MLKIEHLNKTYENGTIALRNINFQVEEGEFLVIIGLSGSGKSTLLRCINQLIPASSGQVIFDDVDMTKIKGQTLRLSRSKIAMIFQHFNLIPRKTVLTNVLSGSLARTNVLKSIFGLFKPSEIQQALKYLEIVGLKEKAHLRADSLSGGQQQRVAIARALMQNPRILLADEPVASLDPATSHSIMDHLKLVNQKMGVTIICNLHFLSLVREYASRVIALKDGKVIFDGRPINIDEKWFQKIYGNNAKEVQIN